MPYLRSLHSASNLKTVFTAKTNYNIFRIDLKFAFTLYLIFFGKINIISISGLRFLPKICQTVAGISVFDQFHELFKSNFWRVFAILAQKCGSSLESQWQDAILDWGLAIILSFLEAMAFYWTTILHTPIHSSLVVVHSTFRVVTILKLQIKSNFLNR